jgi:hypothetical protein
MILTRIASQAANGRKLSRNRVINIPTPTPQPARQSLPWIEVAKDAPYFVTEQGKAWTPIGQNDAITWPELQGAFRRRDLAGVDAHLQSLAAHGVTCLRLMLEYCQGEHRYFERPAGHMQPNMVRLWDDLFALCEKHGLRILLTPYDTFWMWLRWSRHPYNKANGGPCASRRQWLLSAGMRTAIKARLAFATERWGASGALFAWDIWNEIHPAHAGDSAACFNEFTEEISTFLRTTELRLHGRAHLQTVSVFGPVLEDDRAIADCAFRHPHLDFASTHFYEHGTINNPSNTVDAAIATGRLVRNALTELHGRRPFFDSEHGPIHTFKDLHITLPEPFDDEYFRHMQWAHLAAGGAGGGMRWPNRDPHTLTPGMRMAQQALARFLPLINWITFRRKNWNEEITCSQRALAVMGCGDATQAIVWLLRTDTLDKNGMLDRNAAPVTAQLHLPPMAAGLYRVTAWDTCIGRPVRQFEVIHEREQKFWIESLLVRTDVALALQRIE